MSVLRRSDQVLGMLVRAAGEPVPAAEFINEIWGGHASPSTVRRAILTLRREGHEIVATRPEGYSLVSQRLSEMDRLRARVVALEADIERGKKLIGDLFRQPKAEHTERCPVGYCVACAVQEWLGWTPREPRIPWSSDEDDPGVGVQGPGRFF